MLTRRTTTWVLLVMLVVIAAGCSDQSAEQPTAPVDETADDPVAEQTPPPEPQGDVQAASPSPLADTSWEMVEIQFMDDTSLTPEDPTQYTLTLQADGDAFMTLACNRGRGSWSSEEPGLVSFGPIASTSALCQDEGLSERYAGQFEYVRSYVLRDGHLFLATMADGAIIEFRPAAESQAE